MDEQPRGVYALLEEAQELGIGVLFEPDIDDDGNPNGWTVTGVIFGFPWIEQQDGFPGERLSSAYDLETAVAAALKPLRQMSASYDRYLAAKADSERRKQGARSREQADR
jgi:hypothetical protein